jgi:phytoene dehydrogenase-like protein
MDYKKTFLQLLDDPELIPAAQRQKIADTSVSEGIFTVYLGLKMTGADLQKIMHLPYVFYFDKNFGADVRKTDDADFFSKVTLSLYSPSLMNADLAPAGKSSLMISAVVPHHWMDNWGGGDRAAYTALKERVTETIIRRIDGLIPGIAGHIEFKDAATPLTYERYTGNTDGATSAFSWNPKKRFYKNMISSHVMTPVKNLYIGSCWSTQIGGVPSAIGAAQKIAKMLRSKS